MHNVPITGKVKEILDRHVVSGEAADQAAFIEDAVVLYDAQFEDDDEIDFLHEEAARGIADIEAGRYFTISTRSESDAFWHAISTDVDRMVAEARRTGQAGASMRQQDSRTE